MKQWLYFESEVAGIAPEHRLTRLLASLATGMNCRITFIDFAKLMKLDVRLQMAEYANPVPAFLYETELIAFCTDNGLEYEIDDTFVYLGTADADDIVDPPATTIIENRTDDPASPETGRIWLRTDL